METPLSKGAVSPSTSPEFTLMRSIVPGTSPSGSLVAKAKVPSGVMDNTSGSNTGIVASTVREATLMIQTWSPSLQETRAVTPSGVNTTTPGSAPTVTSGPTTLNVARSINETFALPLLTTSA